MGYIKLFKCRRCGNIWEHWEGMGLRQKPIRGNPEENRTGDGDLEIRCPKCGSDDFEREDQKTNVLWD